MQSESYNILEIKDKKIWDEFIISQPTHTFLHSWAWGEFNEAAGDKVWRLGISNPAGLDPDRLVAAALIVKVHARRGNFLFIPHGPIGDKRILPVFIDEIKRLAKQEKVGFIRISPLLQDVEENEKSFRDLGFRPAPIHMHAETTWTLSLQPSEEEILADMRKTTRNLIRRAQKENVTIKTGTSDENIEIFYDLYRETVKKHNFTPFSLASIKNQVKILSHNSEANIFTAWHNGEALASAIIIFYGNSAFYHHGASIHSKIPAAYLLQWEVICAAKLRGYHLYNFWGIVKEDAPVNHPWQGITLFKRGFGGFQIDYLHAQDLPLSWKYWPNYLLEISRRLRRRL